MRPKYVGRLLVPAISLLCAAAHAQTPTFDRDDYDAIRGTRGIVAADLNGDGWIDLARATSQPGALEVHLNRGAGGGFVRGPNVLIGGGPFDIAAGDINRDGRIDLAIANPDANAIDVFITGAPGATWTYTARTSLTTTGNPRGLTLADMTGDGALDVVYTAFYENTVVIVPGLGTGGFSTGRRVIAVGTRPQGVAAGDLNKDGRMDLVVANTGTSPMTVLYGTSAGGFAVQSVGGGQQQMNVVLIDDLDGDTWLDVAAASTPRRWLARWRGSASGLSYEHGARTGESPRGIAAARLPGDSRKALLVANRGDASIDVMLLFTNAGYFVPYPFGAGLGGRAITAADFNRDGLTDFAVGNEFDDIVNVFTNDPSWTPAAYAFDHRPLVTTPLVGSGIATGDFNRNGIPDLVAGKEVILDGNAATRLTLAIPEGAWIKAPAVLDFNRDGHQDVAILFRHFDAPHNSLMDGIYVFTNDGSGGFTFRAGSGGYADTLRIAVGDMNRDGWDDVVIGSRSPTSPQSVLYVLLNNRGNGFAVRQTLLTGILFAMSLADMNVDGRLDVVLTTSEPSAVTVELGDGAGGFSNEAETSIDRPAWDLDVADFTRDGIPDFVVSTLIDIRVLEGDGQGHYARTFAFPPSTIRGGGGTVLRVRAADLTDDSFMDIVTDSGLIIPGREDGSFAPPLAFSWSISPAFTTADIDVDGDLDLIVNREYYGLDVYRNFRVRPNNPPVARAGSDRTIPYQEQFGEDPYRLDGSGSFDPDLHAIELEWRLNGEIVGYGFEPWPGFLPPGTHTFELIVNDGRGGIARDTVTWTITSSPEIVLYTDHAATNGNWQLVEDASAAGGFRIWNPNRNAPKRSSALAAPTDFVELTFAVDPTLEYKLWIRGKAENNHWSNDSVFVQFSDAVDASGSPIYRIGSTSALAFNLEECSGCGIAGWGWEDDGWGAPNTAGVLLRFPRVGYQTIRIQTREDGLSIDQIVLSAVRYRTTRPGAPKNDTTILMRTQY
jgi:hypothetical protein